MTLTNITGGEDGKRVRSSLNHTLYTRGELTSKERTSELAAAIEVDGTHCTKGP